jgi:hypothetical protein
VFFRLGKIIFKNGYILIFMFKELVWEDSKIAARGRKQKACLLK